MDYLKFQNNRVFLDKDEILLVKEFANLIEPKRNKCKEDKNGELGLKAIKELAFIFLNYDWKSPYSEFSEQERKEFNALRSQFPNATPQELLELYQEEGKSEPLSTGAKGSVLRIASIPDNTDGGQCGRFVNKLTGLGLGDSYKSKMDKMDKSIKQAGPGMVFVMPYKETGHTGIILSVKNGIATVKDSNSKLDEKVRTHQIPVSKMTGFKRINV
jgi:hypothetical protein